MIIYDILKRRQLNSTTIKCHLEFSSDMSKSYLNLYKKFLSFVYWGRLHVRLELVTGKLYHFICQRNTNGPCQYLLE